MSNVLKKITARAKQIHRAHPGKKWTTCIKEASAELRASGGHKKASRSRTAKKRGMIRKPYQTGTVRSILADKARKAKPPGKRKSASGATYYERRRNRSDMPGSLAGVSAASLKRALIDKAEHKLGKTFVKKEKAKTKREKNKYSKEIVAIRAQLRKLK